MQRDSIDFSNGKIGVLFRKLFIPTLLGSLSICAVTAIDGIFVGQGTGSDGVAAVNIIVPIWILFSGLELMIGSGCSVVAALHMSKNNDKAARLNVGQAIIFTTIITLAASIAIMMFTDETGRLLGSSQRLMPQVTDYLTYITPCFVFQVWSTIGLFIIRLDGAPKVAMWCNIANAITNAVLDWVFIFPLGMGVKGAAIATGISVVVGGLIAMIYLLFYAKRLKPEFPKWSKTSVRLSVRNICYQCRIGSSSLIGEVLMALLIFVGNLVFMHYMGDDGVGAFGIACYYMPFIFMAGNAVMQSAQPIISFNHGTGDSQRIRQTRRLAFFTATGIGLFTTALFVLFPEMLVALFIDTSTHAARIAIDGLPYFASGYIFFILNICLSSYYQGIERIRPAIAIMLMRGLVFLLPSFMLLPQVLGTEGIWLATPLAEALTLITAVWVWGIRRWGVRR